MLGAAAAGVYNAAYRLLFLLLVMPSFLASALLPRASQLYGQSPDELSDLYTKSFNVAILFSMPMEAGIWLVAPQLILLVYGQEFIDSVPVLRILAALLFLVALAVIASAFLIACDHQSSLTKFQFITACGNLIGNLLLISLIGIQGAALSSLLAEAMLLLLMLYQLKQVIGLPRVGRRLAIVTVSSALFVGVFTFLPPVSLFLSVPVSVLIYSAVVLLFKDVRNNEVSALVTMLRHRPETRVSHP
jgi:O-antigen/teichoic acid export membrane protein